MTTPAEPAAGRARSMLRRRSRKARDVRGAAAVELRERADLDEPGATTAESPTTERRRGPDKGRRRFRMSEAGTALRRESRLMASLVLLAAGIVFVLLGWYGSAHTNILTEQIPYLISGGLLGLGLIVVAGVFAASAANERQARQLRSELAAAIAGLANANHTGGNGRSVATEGTVFVLNGGHSYHVEGCPLLEGKDGVQRRSLSEASAAGLAPCKLCGPD